MRSPPRYTQAPALGYVQSVALWPKRVNKVVHKKIQPRRNAEVFLVRAQVTAHARSTHSDGARRNPSMAGAPEGTLIAPTMLAPLAPYHQPVPPVSAVWPLQTKASGPGPPQKAAKTFSFP